MSQTSRHLRSACSQTARTATHAALLKIPELQKTVSRLTNDIDFGREAHLLDVESVRVNIFIDHDYELTNVRELRPVTHIHSAIP